MKSLFTVFIISIFALSLSAQEGRNISKYNLTSAGQGFISGPRTKPDTRPYDPVSTFISEDGKVLAGLAEFALNYEGVEYYFANAQNMKTFLTDPEKFEPSHGGWCSRALLEGQFVHINTQVYTIVGDRAFYFVSKRAKNFFDRNLEAHITKADRIWKEISGEEPRN